MARSTPKAVGSVKSEDSVSRRQPEYRGLKKHSPFSLAKTLGLPSVNVEPSSLCPVELKLEGLNFHEELLPGVIYTDGRRGDGGISVSGMHILTPTGVMDIKIKNPNFGSVFRSELITIRRVLQFACETEGQFQDVRILTDSRASVQHLSNWTSIGDQICLDILLGWISSNHRVHFP
ncbi:putative RNA-directed DNA polymerase from transposon BS [Trichonephila clavipes]|nr:putative RNA-directed DNA polymerase from transposon BS [Trichonephila clavipes]